MKFYRLLVLLSLLAFSLPGLALSTGDSAMVEWKGQWYPATITSQSDASFRIHYKGYDNSWDEWITPARMRIQVLWKGTWYGAKVLETSGSRAYIHYTGYGSEWDEWVGMNRIRSR